MLPLQMEMKVVTIPSVGQGWSFSRMTHYFSYALYNWRGYTKRGTFARVNHLETVYYLHTTTRGIFEAVNTLLQ